MKYGVTVGSIRTIVSDFAATWHVTIPVLRGEFLAKPYNNSKWLEAASYVLVCYIVYIVQSVEELRLQGCGSYSITTRAADYASVN